MWISTINQSIDRPINQLSKLAEIALLTLSLLACLLILGWRL